jgi:FtsP/CotA-like multicopper oxidase with cupredoxin domain
MYRLIQQLVITVTDQEICDGGTATFTSNVSGGSGMNHYSWQIEIESTWGDIFGADQSTYTTDELPEGTYTYRVLVTQDAGCETLSNEVTVCVVPDPVVVDAIDETSVCEGGVASLQSVVTGGTGTTHYQWQFLFEGEWIDVFGGNSADYTSDPLEIGTYTIE